MSKIKLFFVFSGFLGFIFSFFISSNILSVDILSTLPSFASENDFNQPLNSMSADPVFQFEPWRHYAKNRLGNGEIPFINVNNALGSPFFANQQSAVFSPFQLIYNIFPVSQALFLLYFLKIYLFTLFFYLYFRTIKIAKPVAFFGSFSMPLVGFYVVWLQWPHTNVLMFFPLVLYLTEKILQENRRKYIFNLALSLSYLGIVLAGHPETAFQLFIAHFLYIVFRFRDLRRAMSVLLFSFTGLLLGAFSILPFLEYLVHSFALSTRSVSHATSLPLLSLVVNLIPLIFGGPHLSHYKSIWESVNFQEIIGGYTGIAMLIIAFVAIRKLKKNSISWYWTMLAAISFFLAYGIFPFSVLNNLPVFAVSANHRFIGFFGISVLVLSTIYLNELFLKRKLLFTFRKIAISIAIILPFVAFPLVLPELLNPSTELAWYIDFIGLHLLQILCSSILFFVCLNYFILSKKTIFLVLSYVIFFLSTLFVFQNYNHVTEQEMYYPQTDLTRLLMKLPEGAYLEVGNPQLTENLNLMYGLSTVENYDALEIETFRKAYDLSFPDRNHWGNPDNYTRDGLNTFAIRYVISDYNLDYEKYEIYAERSNVLAPLLESRPVLINLQADQISGIRLLPATFNRKNDCVVSFEIIKIDNTSFFKKTVPCSDFYNNMFFNLETGKLNFETDDNLILKISTNTNDPDNAVSFFGSLENPYLAILKEEKEDKLRLIGQTGAWRLYENNTADEFVGEGKFKVLKREPEEILLEVENEKPWTLEVKRAYFPGWIVRVDGVVHDLVDTTFLMVSLPTGKHLVEFSYVPFSFYIGSVVSIITFIGMLIYLLRNIIPYLSRQDAYESFLKITSSISWYAQVLLGAIGIMLGALFYVLIISQVRLVFTIPASSAINWYTVNGYPRQQDYFYFMSAFIFILIFGLLFWYTAVYLWIKLKK